MRLIVTDADERAALATTRSLGHHHEVWVASTSARSLAGASRFAAGSVVVPDALQDPGGFASSVAGHVERLAADAVLPIGDASCQALLDARDVGPAGGLAKTTLVAPDHAAYTTLSDKETMMALAREHGLGVPDGGPVSDVESAVRAAHGVGWPVVVKPAVSVTDDGAGRRTRPAVLIARDEAELRAGFEGARGASTLLQRCVPGWGEGIFVLRLEGRTLARFAHRRLREKPPSGGVSVLCESVPVDPERLARIESVLDAVGFSGIAMAEFKTDGRESWLMEFNARLWGSLQLAIDAGVDFPKLWIDAIGGRPAPAPPEPRAGLRLRWLWGDVDHALALARGARDASGRSGLGAALSVLLRPAGHGTRWEILRREDPAPFTVASRRWLTGR